jgi:phosphoglycerate dehydrogenase-like enzyme
MAKVLIAPATLAKIEGPFLDALRAAKLEIVFPARQGQLTEDELLRELKGAAAALAGSEPYTRKVIEAHPELRVIARAGVGYDAVDVQAATDRGVVVAFTPGTNQDAVAEHTFLLILGLAKRIVQQDRDTRAARWPRQATLPLRGRTLGIAGLGRIGKAVALRGAAFGMRLLAYEPFPDPAFVAQQKIQLVSFDQLLAESDFLTLHMPLSADAKYLINRQSLAKMKPSAFLINTARGGLIREADLVEALREGRIAGAGIDVFEEEPPPPNHPLFQFDNVILTAHTAGVDLQSRDDMALHAAKAIAALSRGEWPTAQIVNPEVKAKFRW